MLSLWVMPLGDRLPSCVSSPVDCYKQDAASNKALGRDLIPRNPEFLIARVLILCKLSMYLSLSVGNI